MVKKLIVVILLAALCFFSAAIGSGVTIYLMSPQQTRGIPVIGDYRVLTVEEYNYMVYVFGYLSYFYGIPLSHIPEPPTEEEF